MRNTSSAAQPPKARRRANGRLAALVIGVVALVGLSGCSPCEVQTLHGLYAAPEGIVAQVGSQEDGPWGYSLLLSRDGGETWAWTPPEELGIDVAESTTAEESQPQTESEDAEADFVDQDSNSGDDQSGGFGLDAESTETNGTTSKTGPEFEPVRETEACLSNGRCFRTIPGEQVQEQIGGRWETSFRFTDEELRRFEARDHTCNDGTSTRLFGFLTVGGSAPSAEQADFVIVSMGNQGVLRLDGNGDEWERVAVGSLEPISTFGPRWLWVLAVSPLIALVSTPVIFRTNRSHASPNRRGTAAVFHLVLSVCLIALFGLLWLVSLGELDYALTGLLPFFGTLVVFGISLIIVLPRGAEQSLDPPAPTGPPSPVEPPSLRD